MIIFNQDAINNLFYIILSIFLVFFLIEKKFIREKYNRLLMTLSSSMAIILCMLSPIYKNDYCVHDLRMIPFVLGILYGGPVSGVALLVVLLGFRMYLYGWSLVAFTIHITVFLITVFCVKVFKRMSSRGRIFFSFGLFLVHTIISPIIAEWIAYFPTDMKYAINFVLVPSIGMLVITYIVEILIKQINMNYAMMKVEKMEVVSQLAASISHEVRNPLTVVKGFLQMLSSKDLTVDKKDQYIQIANAELSRAENIISDYLTFAKPTPENIVEVKVDEELLKMLDIIEPLAKQHSINVHHQLQPAIVYGNTSNFQQALLNILKNAIEAMPNGGELVISTKLEKDQVTICIQDSGSGMRKEQISRLGEPYFSTKEKGTGLGLMVTFRIIEVMRGKIEVKSIVNKGSTFTICLPK
ncbi:two-component system sporulation sensor kinase B [Bacillus pakistanensis]|uniref:histidine kinase n=1 Tax=Rossellomorea pakistanensis TaxID=992288 RepID=A0ABS2NEQ8_9BACI|nr:HAMP domain-containing sensor histidine kinase [Bacillus pakistanensis]MBM7586336.1 two-component system sporulation sensor kinase B [Bacillus pakistanensis]